MKRGTEVHLEDVRRDRTNSIYLTGISWITGWINLSGK